MDTAQPTESGRLARPWQKRLLIGCVLTVGAGLLLVALFLAWVFHEPASMDAVVHAPSQVRVGEEFRVTVDIRNDDAGSHTLTAVVLDDAYLNGVMLERTEPPFSETQHGAANPIQMYLLSLGVPSGTTQQLLLVARGRTVGQFHSELELVFDHGASHFTREIDTVVVENGETP